MNTLLTSFLFLGGVVGLEAIKKDVVIIGGGSSGIYTGIRLMDEGKDIAIIEKSSYIGSHANTYYDPATGAPLNVGVQSFHNTTIVRDYFARLNVTSEGWTYPQWPTVNVDFITGEAVANYTSANQSAMLEGFQTFQEILAEKYAYLDDGFFLPDPIPEELFLPFSEFATNYGIEAILSQLVTFIQPVEIWKEPTLYVIKNFGLESTEAFLQGLSAGVYHPKDVNEIYIKAAEILGSRVMLNSTAQIVNRSCDGVTVVVNTPDGPISIEAGKIVMAAPPFLQNFQGWDLSSQESDLFSKFLGKDTHIAITRNPTWNNISYNGVGPKSTLGNPRLPGVILVNPTGFTDSSYYSYIGSPDQLSVEDAQALFKEQVNALVADGVMPESENEIIEWFNHNYYMNYVPEEDIRAGFYTELNNLQGNFSTFYVGAVWAGQDSSYIWRAINALLPRLLE